MNILRNSFLIALILLLTSAYAQNNCLEFDGYNDRVVVSKSLDGYAEITAEAWVKPYSFNPQSPDNYISNLIGHDDASVLMRIGDEDASNMVDNNRAQFVVITQNGGVKCNSLTEMEPNTWYHIAGTYDGSNVKIYVNGILEDSKALTGSVSTSISEINIGGQNSSNRFFEGLIDDARIWSIARFEAQLRQNMYTELQGYESGLIANYQFDETSGTTAYDATSNNFNGVLTDMQNNQWKISNAIYGPKNCLWFDGSNDYIDCGSGLNIPGTNISIEAWIYPTDFKSYSFLNTIIGNDYWGGVSSEGYVFRFGGPTGDLDFTMSYAGGYYWTSTTAIGVLSLNKWQHVAVTYNGSEVKLFVNGKNVFAANKSSSIISSSQNARVGSSPGDPGGRMLNGKIDELRVWNVTRTELQIAENFCRTITGNQSGLVANYTFDNSLGTTLQDFSGNGNDGSCMGYETVLSGTVDWTDYEVTFRDYDANWTVDDLIGKTLNITTSGKEQSHEIYDNNDVQLWLDPMDFWSPVITGGETYEIEGNNIVSWESSEAYNSWLNTSSSIWDEPQNWSMGETPTPYHNIGIYSNNSSVYPVINGDLLEPWECNNFYLGDGALVTITSGSGFTVNGNLINEGTIKIKSDATATGSIKDNGIILGSGTWQTERYLPANQWTNFSPPFSDMISGDFELPLVEDPDVFLLENMEESYSYEYIVDDDISLNVAQGYMVWVDGDEASPNVNDWTFTFEGTPVTGIAGNSNNLVMTAPGGIYRGWNFLGNPYLSSIDWAASSGWTKTDVEATTYIYAGNGNWATYTSGSDESTNGGSRFIPPAQAFFAKVTDPGSGYPHTATLTMDNSVRVHQTNSYLKSKKVNEGLVKLQLSGNLHNDELNVKIMENATFEFDAAYDAHKLFSYNEDLPQFFSYGPTELATNCIPAEQPVHLGVYWNQPNENLTISILENTLNDHIYLEDKLLNAFTKINEIEYNFQFIPDYQNRFILHFVPQADGLDNELSKINIYATGSIICLSGISDQNKYELYVHDITGRQIIYIPTVDNSVYDLKTGKGIYLVRISCGYQVFTKKIYLK